MPATWYFPPRIQRQQHYYLPRSPDLRWQSLSGRRLLYQFRGNALLSETPLDSAGVIVVVTNQRGSWLKDPQGRLPDRGFAPGHGRFRPSYALPHLSGSTAPDASIRDRSSAGIFWSLFA